MRVFLILILAVSSLHSAVISGRVIDRETGRPLEGANIQIVGQKRGATADLDGYYSLERLTPGKYTLRASVIGYAKADTTIVLGEDVPLLRIEFRLKSEALRTAPVIVTASRREESILNSPVAVGVYDGEDFRRRNVTTFEDGMRMIGGISMTGNQVSVRNSTGYSRGAGSRVLLLVDGMPCLSGDTGEIKWDALPLGQVAKLEIVKNAGSALYGSNALGGVINIITRKPSVNPTYRATTLFGLYDKPYYAEWRWSDNTRYFRTIEIEHSRTFGKLGFLGSVKEQTDDGYRQGEDSRRTSFFGKFRLPLGDDEVEFLKFGSDITYTDRGHFAQWRDLNQPYLKPEGDLNQRVWSFKGRGYVSWEKRDPADFSFSAVKLNLFYTSWRDNFAGENGGSYSRNLTANLSFQRNLAPIKIKYAGANHIIAGSELYLSKTYAELFGNHFGSGFSFFLQDEIEPAKRVNVSLGMRYDLHKVEGLPTWQRVNPKFGGVWKIGKRATIRASIGYGYRVPSMAELFTNTIVSGLKIVPNPKLKPERAVSYEVGTSLFFSDLSLSFSLFQNDYTDMIEPIPTASEDELEAVVSFVNYTRARIRGMELECRYNFWRLNLYANYVYTQSTDLDSMKALPYRPDHIFTTSLALRWWGKDELEFTYRYKSRLDEVALYKDDPRVDTHLLDAAIKKSLGSLTLTVAVKNILQYYYTDFERNLSPPRRFSLSLSYSF